MNMIRDAVISPCGQYRERLTRIWDPNLPRLVWIMLNPSTADGLVDDPTVRKCIGFAMRWGYGSIEIVNLFTIRATDPRKLRQPDDEPPQSWQAYILGPNRDAAIRRAVATADAVCVAWGAHPEADWAGGHLLDGDLLPARVLCIGRTKHGAPRHPLMAAYTDAPEVLRG